MSHKIIDKLTEGLQIYTVSGGGCVKARVIFGRKGLKMVAVFHEYGSAPVSSEVEGYGYDLQGTALRRIMFTYDQEKGSVADTLKHVQDDGEWHNLLREAGYIVQQIC